MSELYHNLYPVIYWVTLIIMSTFILLMLATVSVNLFFQVPYVPSKKRVIRKVLEIAKLKPGEKVYDLGCGDGRFLIEAEKQAHVIAEGFEIAPIPYLLALLTKFLRKAHVTIKLKNFFSADLSDADTIFCYLGPETLDMLATKLKKECRKGTRIYCNTFRIKGLEPVKIWEKDPATKMPPLYLYQI